MGSALRGGRLGVPPWTRTHWARSTRCLESAARIRETPLGLFGTRNLLAHRNDRESEQIRKVARLSRPLGVPMPDVYGHVAPGTGAPGQADLARPVTFLHAKACMAG